MNSGEEKDLLFIAFDLRDTTSFVQIILQVGMEMSVMWLEGHVIVPGMKEKMEWSGCNAGSCCEGLLLG